MSSDKLKGNDPAKVLVIGAGLAGVTAANKLAERGLDVTVLEASDRIGGRIRTVQTQSGEPYELGATWIHGRRGNPLFSIAQKLGILEPESMLQPQDAGDEGAEEESRLDDKHSASGEEEEDNEEEDGSWLEELTRIPYRTSEGETIEPVQAAKTLSRFQSYIRESSSCRKEESLGDYIDRRWQADEDKDEDNDETARRQRSIVLEGRKSLECSISGCASLYEVSGPLFHTYDELDGVNSPVPGGVQQLVRTEVPVTMHAQVTRISLRERQVLLSTKQGDKYAADYVISTLPLGVLKEHGHRLFEPNLPSQQMNAIKSLGFGVVDKLYLRLDVVLGHKSRIIVCGEERPSWLKYALIFTGVDTQGFSVWLTGSRAREMESLSDDEIVDELLDVVQSSGLVDGKRPNALEFIRSDWGRNPFARGSYSFPGTGSASTSIADLQKALKDKTDTPRVFFAGEATHPTLYSTMTGAYLSGLRAAEEVLQTLSLSPKQTCDSQPSAEASHEENTLCSC